MSSRLRQFLDGTRALPQWTIINDAAGLRMVRRFALLVIIAVFTGLASVALMFAWAATGGQVVILRDLSQWAQWLLYAQAALAWLLPGWYWRRKYRQHREDAASTRPSLGDPGIGERNPSAAHPPAPEI